MLKRRLEVVGEGCQGCGSVAHEGRAVHEPEHPSRRARAALIGGFAVMELSGMEEAVEPCKPYAATLGGPLVIDVRPLEA